MDRLSKHARSRNMSRVKGKDTAPEKFVRSKLHKAGFRFRLHDAKLPGKPDIVLKRYRIVVFVHGCFWHGHSCKRGRQPKTNREFWSEKIAKNKARDRRNAAEIRGLGWNVYTIWECKLDELTDELISNLQAMQDRLV